MSWYPRWKPCCRCFRLGGGGAVRYRGGAAFGGVLPQLGAQRLQLGQHFGALAALLGDLVLLRLQLGHLLALIATEQANRLHRLGQDQQGEGDEDAEYVAGGGFEEVEELAHAGQMPGSNRYSFGMMTACLLLWRRVGTARWGI